MIHNVKSKKIHKRLKLYEIDTKKFKTDLIGVYIKRPLNEKEAAYNTLISRILTQGTENYTSAKKLQQRLDASYGMILVSDVVKYGDYHVLQFRLQVPNKRYIKDENIFYEALDLLHEVIFKPFTKDGIFDLSIFEQEKANLIDEIKARENDKMTYALDRCIELMYEDESYGEYVYGSVEAIESIDCQSLYQHFKEIIEESLFDLCLMGDLKSVYSEKKLLSYFPIKENDFVDFKIDDHIVYTKDIQTIKEVMPVKEGKLLVAFRTNIKHKDPLYEASVLAYHILGGGPSSLLFQLLREQHSLCYYVYVKSDKYKGCMFIGVGVDESDYDQVKDHIFRVLEQLKSKKISQSILDDTMNAMVDSIHALSDFPNSFMNFLYGELIDTSKDYVLNLDKMIKAYKSVSLEDIQAVYRKLHPSLIYFLHGGQHENS
jgi:predicted Zn-dependent peptidase